MLDWETEGKALYRRLGGGQGVKAEAAVEYYVDYVMRDEEYYGAGQVQSQAPQVP
jgi:hypothetical protein